MTPRTPKDTPRRPQEEPRWRQDGPKTTPRRPQDDSKSLPSRIPKQCDVSFTPQSPEMRPRSPQNPTREAQEAPKEPPRGPKRPPRGSQEAPRGPQEASKRPLIGPTFTIKLSSSCRRGCVSHLSYQVACNMSPLGSRRGPALRAESGGVRPLCQTPLGLIKAD